VGDVDWGEGEAGEGALAAAFTQIEKILKALVRTRGQEKLLRDECASCGSWNWNWTATPGGWQWASHWENQASMAV